MIGWLVVGWIDWTKIRSAELLQCDQTNTSGIQSGLKTNTGGFSQSQVGAETTLLHLLQMMRMSDRIKQNKHTNQCSTAVESVYCVCSAPSASYQGLLA